MRLRIALLFLLAAGSAAAQDGCISGKVLDDSSAPLPQMHVLVSALSLPPLYRLADTDENGHFRVYVLRAGDYSIDTHNEDLGYVFGSIPDFAVGDPVHVAVADSSDCATITIRRGPRAARLRLKLIDASSGKEISDPTANFRRLGNYSWDGITLFNGDVLVPPRQPLEVEISAKGFDRTGILKIPPLAPEQVLVMAYSLQPIGVGCLRGTVLDENGRPVTQIKVQPLLQNDDLNAKLPLFGNTDKQGNFEFRDLHPGSYELFVDGQNRGYAAFSVMRSYGEFPAVDVLPAAPCAEISLELAPPGAHLRVEVVDAVTLQPITNSRLAVVSTEPRHSWESRSIARQLLVPAGRPCKLEVEATGYQTYAEILGALQSGETRRLRVLLQPNP